MHLDSKNYILMVFEGEVTEPLIFDSLKQYFINENPNTIVYGFHCGEIYSLYHKLKNDEDLELFPLLQEKLAPKNNEIQSIIESEVSEIYMFFDYDGHASGADDEKLQYMLELFDNETDKGKLYISYPMVEAIQHLGNDVDFENLLAVSEKGYKSIVKSVSDTRYKDISSYTQDDWLSIIEFNAKKLGKLYTDSFIVLDEIQEPIDIFLHQLEKHIIPNSNVSVLSAFPLFLIDYYGYDYLDIK